MDAFSIVFNQLFQFLIMLLAGFIAARTKIIRQEFLSGLSKLITALLLPILIFSNAINGATRDDLIACWPIMVLSACMYAGLTVVFMVTAKMIGLKGDKNRVYRATMIFSNGGFIGIPLILALFPEHGAIYMALMSIVDQIVMWTYAVYLTTPSSETSRFQLKNFLNPALGAIVLAVILLLLNIQIPEMLNTPLLTLGKTATPLSLIYLGGLMYYSKWTQIFKDNSLYIGIVIKMVVFPVLFCIIASLFCAEHEMIQAIAMIAALPSMTVIAMFAQSKDNHGDYALGMVLATTVFSLVTIMAVSWLIF